jgi:Zn-dependent protease
VAGPLANLVLGVLGSAALRLLILADPAVTTHLAGAVVFKLLLYLVYINYGLFVFNLIPIPPLDGSHAAFSALRIKPETEARLYRYGSLALLVLIIGSNQLGIDFLWMGSIVHAIARAVFGLLGF